ncbi:tRNA pseudouridine(55) synthase TruB [Candidatus Parcubacteria bacterium]|nr:MAG: tRNA pseudouridine(55) synthase TruB [Candidatus Parcubacteria bacterium]
MANDENNKNVQSGFVLIDKNPGISSHGVVNALRNITGIKKIGHAGTLDPFASGLLILAIGRESTKQIDYFVKKDKKYIATLKLGASTDTYDREGIIKTSPQTKELETKQIKSCLAEFIGEQDQIPPMFSAKKINGQKLYNLARKGIEIERQPSRINIYDIGIKKFSWPYLEIEVSCSTGTYIRSLANDIGIKLGCGAYLEDLRRTAIGDYNIKNAQKVDILNNSNWGDFLFKITN